MLLLPEEYIYTSSILGWSFSEGEIILSAILLIVGVVLYGSLPFITNYLEQRRQEHDSIEKRKTIDDLRLMKELQGEIEEEMKQALIRAALLEKAPPA